MTNQPDNRLPDADGSEQELPCNDYPYCESWACDEAAKRKQVTDLKAELLEARAEVERLRKAVDYVATSFENDVHLVFGKGQKVGMPRFLHCPSEMQREAKHLRTLLEPTPPGQGAKMLAVVRAAELQEEYHRKERWEEYADACLNTNKTVEAMKENQS